MAPTRNSRSSTSAHKTKPYARSQEYLDRLANKGNDIKITYKVIYLKACNIPFYRASLSIEFPAGSPFHTYLPRVFHSSKDCKSAEAAKEEAAERAVDHLLEIMGAGVEQADHPKLTKYLKDMVQLVKSLCSSFWGLLRRCGVLDRVAEEGAAFHAWLRGLTLNDLQRFFYDLRDALQTREAFVAWADERGREGYDVGQRVVLSARYIAGVRMVEGQLRRHKICDFRGAAGRKTGECAGRLYDSVIGTLEEKAEVNPTSMEARILKLMGRDFKTRQIVTFPPPSRRQPSSIAESPSLPPPSRPTELKTSSTRTINGASQAYDLILKLGIYTFPPPRLHLFAESPSSPFAKPPLYAPQRARIICSRSVIELYWII
ncbi:hypothetical protein BCR35DRAFT_334851 [Leucosporidium creatinivorum]|uniref:Uncharacterized protein n=1 Tax=Leucosporidium creatinivorum TaxID=106004 RepID=A0A1Y2DU67_9BASI|nr:hypothetical protein BCR35DRAFT_334851 [Leucosporidium creatinivorum]